MATLRLFASAREAAGCSIDQFAGATVGDVLDDAVERYGEQFALVLDHSKVWCNGEPTERDRPVGADDEVAVLPPVSGGS
ncbi:MAG: MoaD/ThiS family protein [Acidimicrobiia bacterium]|nr:MoaD/ThiS family protein [Acidimicrobiia bacterium]